MSQITVHVLDTSTGKPATPVPVALYSYQDNNWIKMANGITNSDGRVPGLLDEKEKLLPGVYKLKFDTGVYFMKRSLDHFHPFVEISFMIEGSQHYHIPLLISPYGYTTYRGS